MRVVVVGAGISGATSAFRIKKKYPEAEIKILYAESSPNTTSDIAAGWWEPHLDPDTEPGLVTKWSGATYRLLAALSRGDTVAEMGARMSGDMRASVRRLTGMDFTEAEESRGPPVWSGLVSQYQILSGRDVTMLGLRENEGGEVVGQSYLSFTWEPSKALPIFYKWFRENQVEMENRKLSSLDEVEADLIINCSGLGASELVSDSHLFPVSGHVLRVTCGHVGHTMADNRPESWSYIIPNTDCVVLGSVDRQNNWDTRPDPKETTAILKRCERLQPGIKACPVVSDKVGLRPCRRGGVRCELENILSSGGEKRVVIHNYGHGGSGVTLSWGCAGQVVEIMEKYLQSNPS